MNYVKLYLSIKKYVHTTCLYFLFSIIRILRYPDQQLPVLTDESRFHCINNLAEYVSVNAPVLSDILIFKVHIGISDKYVYVFVLITYILPEPPQQNCVQDNFTKDTNELLNLISSCQNR